MKWSICRLFAGDDSRTRVVEGRKLYRMGMVYFRKGLGIAWEPKSKLSPAVLCGEKSSSVQAEPGGAGGATDTGRGSKRCRLDVPKLRFLVHKGEKCFPVGRQLLGKDAVVTEWL